MNIQIEKSIAELRREKRALYRETGEGLIWMGYCVLLVAGAFLAASHVTYEGNSLHIQLGSPLSGIALAGAVVLGIQSTPLKLA